MNKTEALDKLQLIVEYFQKSSETAVQEILNEALEMGTFAWQLDEIWCMLIEGEAP